MRVFAAGASGAIGMRLVAQLIQAGHEVVGAARSPQKAAGLEALEQAQAGIYNIVDDEPAPVRDWLPVLAKALGAKPPRHFPSRLARLVAGEAGVVMATRTRGASNANANRGLGWTPRYPTWRKGLAAAYATTTVGARTTNHPRGSSADARIARPHSPRVEPRARGDELGPPRRSMWVSHTDPRPDGARRDRSHVERHRGRGRFERHASRARRDCPSAL